MADAFYSSEEKTADNCSVVYKKAERKTRSRAVCILISCLLTAAALSGCSDSATAADNTDILPLVTEYASVAEEMRSADTAQEVTVTASAVTDTIITPVAAASDDELSDSEKLVEESILAAISDAMLDVQLSGNNRELSETSVTEPEPINSDTVYLTTTENTIASEQIVPLSETLYSEAAAAIVSPASPTDYDSDFFAEDLFIGDSISTGYSLYNILPEQNVYAKIGLNPSTVLTKSVSTCYGDIDVGTMLAYTQPKRVYIMLGSNGIQWLSNSNMLKSSDTLVDLIRTTCPDAQIVYVSVPPVTPGYDSTVADIDVMARIDDYNNCLAGYCSGKQISYVDVSEVLKDSTGYFSSSYAESDGMHFKYSTYSVVLSKLQTEMEAYDAEQALIAAETQAPSETLINEDTSAVSEANSDITEAELVSQDTNVSSDTTAPDNKKSAAVTTAKKKD